jgi:hypothetical protein
MSLIRLNRHPSSRQLLVFAAAWLVFLGLFGLAQRMHGRPALATVCWGLAIAVPLVGAAWREGLRLLFVGLSCATYPIGLAVSSVVLVLLYYGVLTPVGLILRFCRHDPLQRRFERARASYWQPRSSRRDSADYFRQH